MLLALGGPALGIVHAQDDVLAETEYVPDETVAEALSELPDGLYPALTLGANLNVASNSNVVGQVDGVSFLTGVAVAGELLFLSGMHHWKNTLSITETWAKTPTLDRFNKSNDVLDFESLYKLFLWSSGGLYARLNVVTTLFPTEQVTENPQTYVVDGGDPATDGIIDRRFELADPLQPFTVSESAGVFYDPVQESYLSVSVRAGFGGRHTLADGARVITDDEDPEAVVYTELEDVHQAGLELFAGFEGRTAEDRIAYNAGLVSLFPFINNDDTDRSSLELTRVALQAGVTMAVFDWMSLSYQLRAVNDPQLVDDVQLTNNLLLTLSYTVVDKPKPPEEPDPLEAELEAQKARAAAAEERARAAEARAVAAEQQLQGTSTAPATPTAPAAPGEVAPGGEPGAVTPPAPPAPGAPAAVPAPGTAPAPVPTPAPDAAPAAP